jgi:hypothetical protein
MTEEEPQPKPAKKKSGDSLAPGKFKNESRQNSRGIPDSQILLPETVRNRALSEKVNSLMQTGHFKTRRAARKSLHKC